MIHLGDITKINGAEIPPVDVITGGSPCQDLSVAGKRAGLDGERSGLFMEQIRIIAVPYWKVLARRIAAQYDRDITMGSLFDGIGGFPLAFEHCGAKAVWASEIEEFCIAVTKHHFPEDND